MKLSAFIDRVKLLASQTSPNEIREDLTESDLMTEVVLPTAIDVLVKEVTSDDSNYVSLMRDTTITFASGAADIAVTICQEFLPSATIIEDPTASFVKDWFTYYRYNGDYQTAIWTVRNDKIYYTRRDNPLGYTGDLTFHWMVKPQVPDSLSKDFEANDDFMDRLVALVASVVSGRLSVADLLKLSHE